MCPVPARFLCKTVSTCARLKTSTLSGLYVSHLTRLVWRLSGFDGIGHKIWPSEETREITR